MKYTDPEQTSTLEMCSFPSFNRSMLIMEPFLRKTKTRVSPAPFKIEGNLNSLEKVKN